MKTYFILMVCVLTPIINVSAQDFKQVPLDYDLKEEKNISIETSYAYRDSVKILFVTVTNKSNKDIRVYNGKNDGAFSIYYLNCDDEMVAMRFHPFGHEPDMNQKIILKPGTSETFRYNAYYYRNKGANNPFRWSIDKTKGPIRKIKIDYKVSYQFMEDENDIRKILHLFKETESVSLF